jgi:maltose-binding protein MalE
MINAFSENKLLAQTFLTEYIATDDVLQKIYETGLRRLPGSLFWKKWMTLTWPQWAKLARTLYPMPNIPEMGSVWSAWINGITLATTGKQSPEDANEGRC